MKLHENRLPADDSHEMSCLICYFLKAAKFEIVVCCNKIGGVLKVNSGKMEEDFDLLTLPIILLEYLYIISNCNLKEASSYICYNSLIMV